MRHNSVTHMKNLCIKSILSNRTIVLLGIGCMLIGSRSVAQTPERVVATQPIQWAFVTSTIKLNSRYGVFVEEQIGLQGGQNMQHVFRMAVDYSLSSKFSVIPFGYAYTWNYQYGKMPSRFVNNEHTIWQQFVFKHGLSRFAINHRLRTEERYIQAHSLDSNNEVVNDGFTNKQFRVRYRLQTNIPLNSAKIEAKTVYLSFWDEAFVSWGKQVTYHKVDQNRVFAGFGYQFTKAFNAQAGYYNQRVVRANGTAVENNVGFLLHANYNFSIN